MTEETAQIKKAFDYLKEHEPDMRFNQVSFIASLRKYYNKEKELTPGQQRVLFEIKLDVERMLWNLAKQKEATGSITVK